MFCGMPRMYGWAVSSRSGAGLRMPAKEPPSGYFWPSARNRSSRPRWSMISMLRACRPSERTIGVGSASLSSTSTGTPCSRSSLASHKPVGPPPATITSIMNPPLPRSRFWLRLQILQHDPGLAASPPVRYTLRVAGSA